MTRRQILALPFVAPLAAKVELKSSRNVPTQTYREAKQRKDQALMQLALAWRLPFTVKL